MAPGHQRYRCKACGRSFTATPPRGKPYQEDPHEFPRRSADGRRQKSAFLQIGGKVIDVCGPRPCYAGTWHGP